MWWRECRYSGERLTVAWGLRTDCVCLPSFLPQAEISSAAAQGKLAYVSPTVRAMPSSSNKVAMAAHPHAGASASRLRPAPANLNLSRGVGAAGGLGQLSPVQASVQLGQPVLLNAPSQVEVRRYVGAPVFCVAGSEAFLPQLKTESGCFERV